MTDEDGKERPERVAYRICTRRHDVATGWEGLAMALGASASPASTLERAWRVAENELLPWRTALLVAASQAAVRLRSTLPPGALADTAITLLLDQSGSMRGQKMLYAATTLDVMQEFLAGLGMRVEVLGFTTVTWRGGPAYWWWRLLGRRAMPGRLNGLLHIVYREADDTRVSSAPYTFREMLRPELPKENIDGEALEWAASRLRTGKEGRKILLVLSDGAPVDDATLLANHSHYLEDHLLEVIGELSASTDIELAAMGIGFGVSRYYPRSESVTEAETLGAALLAQIEHLLLEPVAPRA